MSFKLKQTAKSLIQGLPFGRTFPPRPDPPLPYEDGRTAALSVLAQYISELTFFLPPSLEPGAKPIPMTIGLNNIFIEQPDNVEDLKMPSLVFKDVAGGDYTVIGLTTFLDENSANKFGKGTAVQIQSEYMEIVTLEIWASKRAERRAILAGLECALVPTEQMYGIRFKMPDYFDQTVCFTLNRSIRLDDQWAAQGRRVSRIELEMRFNVVRVVNVVNVQPFADIDVSEDPTIVTLNEPIVGEPPKDPTLG